MCVCVCVCHFLSSPLPLFQVASTLVFGNLLSAPIMYVSARMVLIQFASVDDYSYIIANSKRDISILAMACVVSPYIGIEGAQEIVAVNLYSPFCSCGSSFSS